MNNEFIKKKIKQDNFNEKNIESISKPFSIATEGAFRMLEKQNPCKVKPSISSMKRTAEMLLK